MTILRIFIPFALGFFLSYVFRVVNNVLSPNLVADLGLSAADLGMLTSVYFLTFAAFQIPLGLFLDRFGPRRTEATLLVFAAAGAFLFAFADSITGLVIGRALIGFGVSSCLMAALTAYVLWFPAERLPLANGCHMAAGGVGALVATQPVEWALTITDWRGVFLAAGVLTLCVALLILLVVPERHTEQQSDSLVERIRDIARIFSSGVFWRIAPVMVASQATFLAIQGLWSGAWLRDVGGLDRAVVADHLLAIAAAMIVGMVIAGWVTERLGRLGVSTMTSVIGFTVIFMVFQTAIVMGWTSHTLSLWIGFGFIGNTGVLAFAALSQAFPKRLAGRVVTALNLLAIMGAWAAQWGIGLIINQWPATPNGGYDPHAYPYAFGVLLVLQILAVFGFIFFRADKAIDQTKQS